MTLMKDLITIPEQVLKGDFVLKASEVVEDPSKAQQALKDYVVTPQLVKCFERSLELIKVLLRCSVACRAARRVQGVFLIY